MSMVTGGKCEKFNKKHLGLLLEKKNRNKKKGKSCCNPSLGLMIKARVCKVAVQEEVRE